MRRLSPMLDDLATGSRMQAVRRHEDGVERNQAKPILTLQAKGLLIALSLSLSMWAVIIWAVARWVQPR